MRIAHLQLERVKSAFALSLDIHESVLSLSTIPLLVTSPSPATSSEMVNHTPKASTKGRREYPHLRADTQFDFISKPRMGEKALNLFNSMRGRGIQPDSITIVAVLSACSYAGLVDEGLQVFESMEREYNVRPSAEHYCCVVDMLGKVGKVVEAYEFVKGLGEEGKVLGIWGSLLASCRTHGKFQLGKVVANKLLDMEWEKKTTGYHVLLSNIYAEEGNWANVNRVRKEMQEKGISKEMGCSWIDVAGKMNFFMSRDQKHIQGEEIYEMLEVLTIGLKDSD